ncbi:hypothetical protein PMAYCL1PPCAC_10343, partial [Pristionchus mayeri]
LLSALLLALFHAVFSQCTGADSSSCPKWIANGYCTNTAASMEMRKLYCGVGCGFCFRNGTQTAAGGGSTVTCVDNNANCASWAADGFCTSTANSPAMKNQFCCKTCASATTTTPTVATDGNANCARWSSDATIAYCASTTVTKAQKTLYCAKTCAFEITPNADCALYTLTGTTFARGTPSNRTTAPGTAVASGAVAGTTTLSRAFAADKCTITLYTEAAGTTALTPTMVGTATTNFFTVAAANNGALSYSCVCTA